MHKTIELPAFETWGFVEYLAYFGLCYGNEWIEFEYDTNSKVGRAVLLDDASEEETDKFLEIYSIYHLNMSNPGKIELFEQYFDWISDAEHVAVNNASDTLYNMGQSVEYQEVKAALYDGFFNGVCNLQEVIRSKYIDLMTERMKDELRDLSYTLSNFSPAYDRHR